MSFQVHEKLLQDCEVLGDLQLSRVLLMRDARFPWLILVPREEGLRDLHELPHECRSHLFEEIERASLAVKALIEADKINVAALGNQVPQLHVHVIARRLDDSAWPSSVWGSGSVEPYSDDDLRDTAQTLAHALGIADQV